MANLYEFYNAGDNDYYSDPWAAQTFTVGSAGPAQKHTIKSIKLKLFKNGAPGVVTFSIRNTAAGKPTGGDLCSGTYDCDTLGASPGAFVDIFLGAGTLLVPGTMYAIVCPIPGGNTFRWRADTTGPTYGGGTCVGSADGVNWLIYAGLDLMFEEWGDPIAASPKGAIPARLLAGGLI